MVHKHPHLIHPKYRPDIDGLRAIAIISVLLFHAFPTFLPGGLVGVDVFFVISGYLITGILIKNTKLTLGVLSNFYARRVRRIFPALIITLVLTYGFGFFALYADDFKVLGLDIASAAAFLSNIRYLNDLGYFDTEAVFRPLLHLWSLGVEEQYYLLWPLMVFWILKRNHSSQIILLLIAISFAFNVYYAYLHVDWAYYLPFTRFWELFAGALLAVKEKESRFVHSEAISMAGMIVLVLACFFVDGTAHFPGWKALFPVLATYMLIQHAREGFVKHILSSKLLVGMGLISYPLYLYHWPLLTYARITEVNPSWVTIVILLLVATFLAALTYQYIERPIRRRGMGWTVGLVVLMLIVGIFGYSAYDREGMNFRQVEYNLYKKDIQHFFKGDFTELYHSDVKFVQPPVAYIQALEKLTNAVRTNTFRRKMAEEFYSINAESNMCQSGDCQLDLDRSKKLVVVVGDSHAENAFYAIQEAYPDLNVVQFTDSGCYPISARYTDASNRCGKMMRSAFHFAQKNTPDLVILAARWPDYFQQVIDDINAFRALAKHVAMIGPSLVFKTHVKRFLVRYDDSGDINAYVNSFIDTNKFKLNEEMRLFAKKNSVPFINKIKAFCGDGYCKITKSGGELYIPDKGHLHPSGIDFWAQDLRKNEDLPKIMGDDAK